MSLAKLGGQHLQLLYARKLEEGLSSTSVRHLHTVLHRALETAVRQGLVQRNVAELVAPPRMRHHEMATLSEEQARSLLEAARSVRLGGLYALAPATGCALENCSD